MCPGPATLIHSQHRTNAMLLMWGKNSTAQNKRQIIVTHLTVQILATQMQLNKFDNVLSDSS